MSDNSGQYRSDIFRVGTLSGLAGNLYAGSDFRNPPLNISGESGTLDFNPGVGNRVILYIADLISEETREQPNLFDFGIYVAWSYFGRLKGGRDRPDADINGETTYRNFMDGFDPSVSPSLLDMRKQWWQEAKVDYFDAQTLQVEDWGLQRGEMRYNYYKFPLDNNFFYDEGPGPDRGARSPNIFRVISMTAKADFMRVFWYDNKNFLFPGYTNQDRVDIWAMRGHDAPGSPLLGAHIPIPEED
jgi:hypothetical protein